MIDNYGVKGTGNLAGGSEGGRSRPLLLPLFNIDGDDLKPDALWLNAKHVINPEARFKINLTPSAKERINKANEYVYSLLETKKCVYGINTGFGYLCEVNIPPDKITELQRNIILSHSCGVGDEYPRDIVMAGWLILLNSIARGHRGVSLQTVETATRLLESGILSCVPSRGSVGASGDLVPSAHAALPLLGEGMCTIPNGDTFLRVSAKEALDMAGIKPIELGHKEGLSLINGTQYTTAMAIKLWHDSKTLLKIANLAAIFNVEVMGCSHKIISRHVLTEHSHPGTIECGKEMADWLGGPTEISENYGSCHRVQDPYCLRCAPQVHGAVYEEIQRSEQILYHEINSTTDNPLLFPEEHLTLNGGNFHAIYVARLCDCLASALTTLGSISERRINMAMCEDRSGLPTFLIKDGGLYSGFMMVQTTAAALASECKSLSFPASVDSIPTNCDKEDHVSMGPIAGHKALKIVNNVRYILAIELMVATQSLDLLSPLKTSERLMNVHSYIRQYIPFVETDCILSGYIEKIAQIIKEGGLLLL
ncbi:MAG: histidine ammonia-lyase [Nitrospirae bacterium]|nr:histidine ammonia-lyase [Nitrospirota bacterium]